MGRSSILPDIAQTLFDESALPKGNCKKSPYDNEAHEWHVLFYVPDGVIQLLCKWCLLPVTIGLRDVEVPAEEPDDSGIVLPN